MTSFNHQLDFTATSNLKKKNRPLEAQKASQLRDEWCETDENNEEDTIFVNL